MVDSKDVQQKIQELDYLQNITSLTDKLKQQLDELSVHVKNMHDNAECVSQVMKNWNSVINSISQASLSLLQYTENDYEVGCWNNDSENKNKEVPLPETLVRVKVINEKQ